MSETLRGTVETESAAPAPNRPVVQAQHPPGTLHTFSQLIATAEDGRLHDDLSSELNRLISTLVDHNASSRGKANGSLALTLKFSLDAGNVEMKAEVKVSEPKQERTKTFMWAGVTKRLTGRNPNQRDFFMDAVPGNRN